jgi:hypothetical protein
VNSSEERFFVYCATKSDLMIPAARRDLAGVQFLKTAISDFEFAALIELILLPGKLH